MAAEVAMAVGIPVLRTVAERMATAIFSGKSSLENLGKNDEYVTPNARIPNEVHVHIIKIENLFNPHWHPKMDPFIAVYLSGKKKERVRTKTIRFGGKNCKVDQTLNLPYMGEPRLVIQVFDNGTFGVEDIFIAEIPMDVLPILNNPSRKWTGPVVLRNRKDKAMQDKGKVYITVSFDGGDPYHPMNPTLKRIDAMRVPRGPPPPPLNPSLMMGGARPHSPMVQTAGMMSRPGMMNPMSAGGAGSYQNMPSPYQNMPSPYQNMASPYQNMPSPYQSAPAPHQSAPSPVSGSRHSRVHSGHASSSHHPAPVMYNATHSPSGGRQSSHSSGGAPYTQCSSGGHHQGSHQPSYTVPPPTKQGGVYGSQAFEYPYNFNAYFPPEVGEQLKKMKEEDLIETIIFTD